MTHNTPDEAAKLIQCGACFRSFETPAQFGQHSRICREGKAVASHIVPSETYRYAYMETQTSAKQNLEIKSRFVLEIADSTDWGKVSKTAGLSDSKLRRSLHLRNILNVNVSVRRRQASGLITANFIARGVGQNPADIHAAKKSIERAVDCVYAQLPREVTMRPHLCTYPGCRSLVIRDTEGFCSRHRAKKYHLKTVERDQLLTSLCQAGYLSLQTTTRNENETSSSAVGQIPTTTELHSNVNEDVLTAINEEVLAAQTLLNLRAQCLQLNERHRRAVLAAQATAAEQKSSEMSFAPFMASSTPQKRDMASECPDKDHTVLPSSSQQSLLIDHISSSSTSSLTSLSASLSSPPPSSNPCVGFVAPYVPTSMEVTMPMPITFVPVMQDFHASHFSQQKNQRNDTSTQW